MQVLSLRGKVKNKKAKKEMGRLSWSPLSSTFNALTLLNHIIPMIMLLLQ